MRFNLLGSTYVVPTLPWYMYLPEVTRVFQSPNIDNTQIAKIMEKDSIIYVGSVLKGELVGNSDVWLWCNDGTGFIPGYYAESTYYWSNPQWTYYLQQGYRSLPIDGNLLLLDSNRYIDPENVVNRIGGDLVYTRYLVWVYWHYSRIVNINPLIPIAQSLLETGNFTSWWFYNCNNPAGIGVTGQVRDMPTPYSSWVWDNRTKKYREGIKFNTIEEGIKAHIGRLLAYWYKLDDVTESQQQELIQTAISYRKVPPSVRGVLQHGIANLQGKWALDDQYTSKLLRNLRWLV